MFMRLLGKMGHGVKRNWRQLALGFGVAGLAGLAFCWGRSSALCQSVSPRPAVAAKPGESVPNAPLAPDSGSDYSRRVVAYIYKNIPITREDLGEYLIARYGLDKVEALVNHKIVDMACQARHIHITDAEVQSALHQDLQGLHLSPEDFEKKLLKPRQANLYSWKEDVIRPKLALAQFCRNRVKVTPEDIRKAFESRYGPKVHCRMILVPKDQGRTVYRLREQVSKKGKEGEAAFDKAAREQSVPALAARGGDVSPIFKHFPDKLIEKEAFSLDVGDVSKLLATPDGYVILKCVAHIPADKTKKQSQERAALEKELYDQKIMQEIPKVLKEMRAKAKPEFFFKKSMTESELIRKSGEMMSPQARGLKQGPTAPHGN
jgi:hypothetical protein